MVYKYTSSLNFNVLTTFTLQPSSVFHCLKKCSPHFALNWWVCIAKVGYYKHCSHHRFRNRFIRENANWRNGMECGGDQELPGLNARKACPGASPQHTHCSALRTENWTPNTTTWTLPHKTCSSSAASNLPRGSCILCCTSAFCLGRATVSASCWVVGQLLWFGYIFSFC